MYKQQTPVSQSRVSVLAVLLLVTGYPPLTFVSALSGGHRGDGQHYPQLNFNLFYLEKFLRYSELRLVMNRQSFGWQRREWRWGRCRIIKCQYPRTPLRGSIIVYIYNLYLVCHYLIERKTQPGSSRDRGHSSKRRRLKILSIEMLLWFLPPSYVWPGYARHIRLLTRHGEPLTLVNESGDKSSRVQVTNHGIVVSFCHSPLCPPAMARVWCLVNIWCRPHLHDKDPLTPDMWWPANLGPDWGH